MRNAMEPPPSVTTRWTLPRSSHEAQSPRAEQPRSKRVPGAGIHSTLTFDGRPQRLATGVIALIAPISGSAGTAKARVRTIEDACIHAIGKSSAASPPRPSSPGTAQHATKRNPKPYPQSVHRSPPKPFHHVRAASAPPVPPGTGGFPAPDVPSGSAPNVRHTCVTCVARASGYRPSPPRSTSCTLDETAGQRRFSAGSRIATHAT